MLVTIQPPEMNMPQDKNNMFVFEYKTQQEAEVKANEINGVVLKEHDKEIYRVFKTVPNGTIGWMEE